MSKTINIPVESYKQIINLCNELGIDATSYDGIDKKFACKLIFDLSRIFLFKKGDLKNGVIKAPIPSDYKKGGKYDI